MEYDKNYNPHGFKPLQHLTKGGATQPAKAVLPEPKWIEFRPQPQTGKTKIFHIYNKEYNSFLGEIKWYSPFRKYTFYPAQNCVFEQTCLQDIVSFLNKLTLERKLEKQK